MTNIILMALEYCRSKNYIVSVEVTKSHGIGSNNSTATVPHPHRGREADRSSASDGKQHEEMVRGHYRLFMLAD